MHTTFTNYRAFESTESAGASLGQLLDDAGIPYRISVASRDSDLMFGMGGTPMNIWLQLLPSDFNRVTTLLEQSAYKHTPIDTDHFLYAFSDAELREVLYKFDEWSPDDIGMARRILETRGIFITDTSLATMRAERITELRRPSRAEWWVVAFGFAIAVAGGLFSIAIGWSFYTATATDPEGRKYYVYDDYSRTMGRDMMTVGSIILFLSFGLYIYMRTRY